MHEVKLRLVKKENAHYPNGCKQTKVDRKMIEYIIPTNRIKHSNHLKRTTTRDMLSSVSEWNADLLSDFQSRAFSANRLSVDVVRLFKKTISNPNR